jgi:hypothetical protein
MATYTVRRSKHATLAANTVDTLKLSTKPKTVEVRNLDSTAVIFFRTDGDAPTVNGDDTDRLGPGERLEIDAANFDPPQVQLISRLVRCRCVQPRAELLERRSVATRVLPNRNRHSSSRHQQPNRWGH